MSFFNTSFYISNYDRITKTFTFWKKDVHKFFVNIVDISTNLCHIIFLYNPKCNYKCIRCLGLCRFHVNRESWHMHLDFWFVKERKIDVSWKNHDSCHLYIRKPIMLSIHFVHIPTRIQTGISTVIQFLVYYLKLGFIIM